MDQKKQTGEIFAGLLVWRAEHMTDVSVIIPVYNVEKYVGACLESVLMQTHRNIEILCIDDGSEDDSGRIVDDFASRDSRIRVVHTENRGLSCARNTGLSMATGKYVYFLDSDDMLNPAAIERMYLRAEKDQLDLLRVQAENFADDDAYSQTAQKRNDVYRRACSWRYDGVCDGKTLMEMHISKGGYRTPVWMYFVLRALVTEHQMAFYPGILFEDNPWTFELHMKAKRAGVLYDCVCRRRIWGDSITMRPKRYEHFYGLFTAYREIIRIAAENGMQHDCRCDVIMKDAARIHHSAVEMYLALNEDERNRVKEMKGEEKMLFYSTFWRTAKETEKQKNENKRLKREIQTLRSSEAFRLGKAMLYIPRKLLTALGVKKNKE